MSMRSLFTVFFRSKSTAVGVICYTRAPERSSGITGDYSMVAGSNKLTLRLEGCRQTTAIQQM